MIESYLETISNFEKTFLNFLDEEDFGEDKIIKFLTDQKFEENPESLRSILYIISKIEKYHYRSPQFYDKIGKILEFYKNKMTEYFDNEEIFHIFKKNKRLLLYLFETKIIIPDNTIKSIITNDFYKLRNYPEYFYPEFKNLYEKDYADKVKANIGDITTDEFEHNRKVGENEKYICELIRNDSIQEFVKYVNETNFSLQSEFKQSIYETHSIFSIKEWFCYPTVIQYAAFFGSIQIFQYLLLNHIRLESNIWGYAIYSPQYEIIQILEENKIKPLYSYYQSYIDCIKLHNINLANYIYENFLEKKSMKPIDQIELALQYYSFNCFNDFDIKSVFNSENLFSNNEIKFIVFYDFCQFDYYQIVDYILKNEVIDINMKRIFEKLNFLKFLNIFFFESYFN